MWRSILGTVGGLAASVIVIVLMQKVGSWIHPMPPGLDLKDKEAMGAWIKTLPPGAFMVLLAGYVLGSAAGGGTAALIAHSLWPSIIVGIVLTLGGIANLFAIPHPVWFAAASLSLYLPVAWMAGKLVVKA